MKSAIKNICRNVTSCGFPTYIPLAHVFASMFVFPMLFSIQLLWRFFPDLAQWVLLGLGIISFVALLITLHAEHETTPVLATDKIMGLLIAFIGIDWSLRQMTIGFLIFHVLRAVMPYLLKKLAGFDIYTLGSLIATITLSVASGLFVNGTLHLMIWVTR